MEDKQKIAEGILARVPELQDKVSEIVANMIVSGEVNFESEAHMQDFITDLIINCGKSVIEKLKEQNNGGQEHND